MVATSLGHSAKVRFGEQQESKEMCSKVTCNKCGKATWSGCGQHVDQVMRGIPKSQQCQGHANEPKAPGFLARLFGAK